MNLVLLSLVIAEGVSCRAPTKQGRAGKHSVALLEPHPKQAAGLDIPRNWGMGCNDQEKVTYSKVYPQPR